MIFGSYPPNQISFTCRRTIPPSFMKRRAMPARSLPSEWGTRWAPGLATNAIGMILGSGLDHGVQVGPTTGDGEIRAQEETSGGRGNPIRVVPEWWCAIS